MKRTLTALLIILSLFSYTGLIDQLEFEGFAHEQACYGADSVGLT